MKLPRDLSGTELIKLLCKHYGYGRVNQEGSHVVLEAAWPATAGSSSGEQVTKGKHEKKVMK